MAELKVAAIQGNTPNFRIELEENSTLSTQAQVNILGQSYIPLPSGSSQHNETGSVRFFNGNLEAYINGIWTSTSGVSNAIGAELFVGTEGNGGGISIAEGADDTNATRYTHGGNYILHEGMRYNDGTTGDETLGATGNCRRFLEYVSSTSGSDFAFHTGHSSPGGVAWPQYLAVKVSNYTYGKVLNRIRWYKHTNAIGNVNVWGSNQSINRLNFTDTAANWTFISRLHFGGFGSGSEGGQVTQSFTNNFGYRWYLVEMVDINSSALSYPNVGSRGGWAMYSMTFDKT